MTLTKWQDQRIVNDTSKLAFDIPIVLQIQCYLCLLALFSLLACHVVQRFMVTCDARHSNEYWKDHRQEQHTAVRTVMSRPYWCEVKLARITTMSATIWCHPLNWHSTAPLFLSIHLRPTSQLIFAVCSDNLVGAAARRSWDLVMS